MALTFKRQPWAHQLSAITKFKSCLEQGINYFALFMEVGTGKTLTMVNMLRLVAMKEGRVPRTLILSPLITLQNWESEVLLNSHIKKENIHILTGSGRKKAALIKECEGGILIANYEILYSEDVLLALKRWGVECLICDESHKLKDSTSKRTKEVLRIAKAAKYRFIMTGTPVLKNLMDLWSQAFILDMGQRLSTSFFSFRNRYFVNVNAGVLFKDWPDWRPIPSAEKDIGAKLADISHQAKKLECLDLPPLVRIPILTELTNEQKKHYLLMEHDLITYVNSQESTASIALTKALRLQQIVSGFIKTDDGNEIEFKNTPREAALHDLLSNMCPENKVIVWAIYKKNYELIRRVCEKLKLNSVEIHGDVGNEDKYSNMHSFNNDPAISVLIAHPGSGGVGVNLVSSNCSIYYSRGFSLEFDLQSESRNHRGGSEIHDKITRYDLIAQGTIDQEILESLKTKEEIGFKTLKAMMEKRR